MVNIIVLILIPIYSHGVLLSSFPAGKTAFSGLAGNNASLLLPGSENSFFGSEVNKEISICRTSAYTLAYV